MYTHIYLILSFPTKCNPIASDHANADAKGSAHIVRTRHSRESNGAYLLLKHGQMYKYRQTTAHKQICIYKILMHETDI